MKTSYAAIGSAAWAAAVILACLACLHFRPVFIGRLDNLAYDTLMRLAEKPSPGTVPVIVEIDDKSLEKLGQWPWPRTVLADLAQKLLDAGAASVALDILLAEPDRSSPSFLQFSLKERLGIDIDLGKVPHEFLDNDLYFSQVIRGKPVILGAAAMFSEAGRLPKELPKPVGLVEKTPPGAPDPRETVSRATGFLPPMKVFSDAAPVGIINASVHDDGVIRTVPLLARVGDNIYASLALRALMSALGRTTLRLDSDQDGLAWLQAGRVRVPVGADGSFQPVYRGPARTYPYYSAVDVLDGKIGKDELEGKIVFVGPSAVGLLDIRATPLDPVMPGVEAHATIVDNMLSGDHISIPSYSEDMQSAAIIISAGLAFVIFTFLPAMAYAPLAIGLIAGWLWLSWHFFCEGIFLSPVYALIAALLTGALILPHRFWREQRAKRLIKQSFSHYVAPEVVNRIAAEGPKALAGEKRELSVLFTDVRGFTTISEKMDPGQLVKLLNSYFTPMTACVIARGGTLDKFIGDALMAFWNAPLIVERHQEKAVLAALDMQKKLEKLRPQFNRDFGVEIRIGAGIHSGLVQVGNMGSADLLNYTCIGDNVNLASRLEGLCKRYGVGIVVSSAVVEKCEGMHFRPLDRIRVKGSSRPLDIFTPLNPDESADEQLEIRWKEALEAYFGGDFAAAAFTFEQLMGIEELKTAALLFIDRCRQLQADRPNAWDGVWTYATK